MHDFLGTLHTMVVSQEDKEFQQFDQSRAKVCPLSLHTKGQQPKDNVCQNAFVIAVFVRFGVKSLASGQKFV
jgi:hypothetical protein